MRRTEAAFVVACVGVVLMLFEQWTAAMFVNQLSTLLFQTELFIDVAAAFFVLDLIWLFDPVASLRILLVGLCAIYIHAVVNTNWTHVLVARIAPFH
jgi:hypothetical protein